MLWKGTGDNVHFNHHVHPDYLAGWKYLVSPDFRAKTNAAWERESGLEIGVQIASAAVGALISAAAAAVLALLLVQMIAP